MLSLFFSLRYIGSYSVGRKFHLHIFLHVVANQALNVHRSKHFNKWMRRCSILFVRDVKVRITSPRNHVEHLSSSYARCSFSSTSSFNQPLSFTLRATAATFIRHNNWRCITCPPRIILRWAVSTHIQPLKKIRFLSDTVNLAMNSFHTSLQYERNISYTYLRAFFWKIIRHVLLSLR